MNFALYILAECAIIATDIAEVIGSAIAINLLTGLPLVYGILLTGLDVFVILFAFQSKFLRYFEGFIAILVCTVALCFAILLAKVDVNWGQTFYGYLPIVTVFKDPNALYLAMGVMGATVMPHNLYLHSYLVRFRTNASGSEVAVKDIEKETIESPKNVPEIIIYSSIDCFFTMFLSFFVNSSILIVAAAAFFSRQQNASELPQAYSLLQQFIGNGAAVTFAVALLCSGQSSSITGTLAGQVVMSGFLQLKIKPWIRRLVTRAFSVVPALLVAIFDVGGLGKLLVLSQVVLSLQLPFAIIPLVYFTNSKKIMTLYPDAEDQEKTIGEENSFIEPPNVEIASTLSHLPAPLGHDYSNSRTLVIFSSFVALLLTGLNVYLLTTINQAFSA